MILRQHPEWKTFALEMDTFVGSTRRHSDVRVIDGDPYVMETLLVSSTVRWGLDLSIRLIVSGFLLRDLLQHHMVRLIMKTIAWCQLLGRSDQEMSCLHTMSGIRIPPFLNYVLCLRHNIPYLYTCILAFFIYNVICNYVSYTVKIFWIWYCIEYSAF